MFFKFNEGKMNKQEREALELLKEKGVSLEQLKGKTVGEVKEMTEQYKKQIRRLES